IGLEPFDLERCELLVEPGLLELGQCNRSRRRGVVDGLLRGCGLRAQRLHSLELGRCSLMHGLLEPYDDVGLGAHLGSVELGLLHARFQLRNDLILLDPVRALDQYACKRSLHRHRQLEDVVRADQAGGMTRIVRQRLAPRGSSGQQHESGNRCPALRSQCQSSPPANAISLANCSSRRKSCRRPPLLRLSEMRCAHAIARGVKPGQRASTPRQLPARKRNTPSSRETNSMTTPGSPWRAQRPISWRSTRRESWRSQSITTSPPSSATPSPRRMSVPRPAMLVTTVMTPRWPARATISASALSCAALSTLCGTPSAVSAALARSASPTLRTATRAGRPCW